MKITKELIHERFHYDENSGLLYWKFTNPSHFENSIKRTAEVKSNHFNKTYAGKIALNSIGSAGYRHGTLYGKDFSAHRIIWLLKYGEWPEVIDHINGDILDNKLNNLRNTSFEGNQHNRRKNKNNTSGTTGVRFNIAAQKWYSSIKYKGEFHYFGSYKEEKDAVNAFEKGKLELGFHELHGTDKTI